jgi:hypothetical protein
MVGLTQPFGYKTLCTLLSDPQVWLLLACTVACSVDGSRWLDLGPIKPNSDGTRAATSLYGIVAGSLLASSHRRSDVDIQAATSLKDGRRVSLDDNCGNLKMSKEGVWSGLDNELALAHGWLHACWHRRI